MVKIVPLPVEVQIRDGSFCFNDNVQIISSDRSETLKLTRYFINEIRNRYSINLNEIDSGGGDSNTIEFKLDNDLILPHKHGYELSIKNSQIRISSQTTDGLFYGIQSLLLIIDQSLSANNNQIRTLRMLDYPRFEWRGMHLDVSRHFFPKKFLLKFIDILAIHKMNKFHLHLTDDQGWRLEIKKYPKLTEIGAWRKRKDGSTYGGYYTQKDIQEIIKYAQSRFVEIIPEIDMPGHITSALAAYPEYSCTGGPFKVLNEWGIFDNVLCPGNDKTFTFVNEILDEVMSLFPGNYIHIGGDECPTVNWQKHDLCQKRICTLNLKNESGLYKYFVNRIAKYIDSKGKIPITWDEALNETAPNEMVIMAWRGIDQGSDAVEKGHNVIMSPTSNCYFDFYQAKGNEPKAIGGYLPLKRVYEFDPIPENLTADKFSNILGGQGNIWTEYMDNENHVEYMALPRMSALAEVLWSPKRLLNYDNFKCRLESFKDSLDLIQSTE